MNQKLLFQYLAAEAVGLKVRHGDIARRAKENEDAMSVHREHFKKNIATMFPLDSVAHVAIEGELWRLTYDGVVINDSKEPILIALLVASLYDIIVGDISNITLTLGETMSRCEDKIKEVCQQLSQLGLGEMTIEVTVNAPQINIVFKKPRYH